MTLNLISVLIFFRLYTTGLIQIIKMVLKFSIETDVKSRGYLYIATGFIFSDNQIFWCPDKFVCSMVFNANFNNILAISWWCPDKRITINMP
jgi:hypothetical protein